MQAENCLGFFKKQKKKAIYLHIQMYGLYHLCITHSKVNVSPQVKQHSPLGLYFILQSVMSLHIVLEQTSPLVVQKHL